MEQENSNNASALVDFVNKWGGVQLFSTGAEVVDYSGELFNVDGSSDDPPINGLSWKGLLIENLIEGNCYVANITPPMQSSHPKFSVGGHMTTNRDGSVEHGGICYLMPLCSWHNSKARDHMAFELTNTSMIKLSGYMESEPAATFLARHPGNDDFTMIAFTPTTDEASERRTAWSNAQKDLLFQQFDTKPELPFHLLFKKHQKNGETFFSIEDAQLPK